MNGAVLLHTVRGRLRGMAGWTFGLIAAALMVLAIYPTIRDNSGFIDLVESYPEALLAMLGIDATDYLSGAGYLSAQLYAVYVPLFMLMLGIGFGARAIAGEEDQGTLVMLLGNPITRTRVLMEKAAALTCLVAVPLLGVAVTILTVGPAFGVTVNVRGVLAVTLLAYLLAVAHGFIAMAAGSAGLRRGAAVAVAALVAAAGYLVNGLASLVHDLAWLRRLSPFYYYQEHDPLRGGAVAGDAAVLAALALAALAVALPLFRRRDLRA